MHLPRLNITHNRYEVSEILQPLPVGKPAMDTVPPQNRQLSVREGSKGNAWRTVENIGRHLLRTAHQAETVDNRRSERMRKAEI